MEEKSPDVQLPWLSSGVPVGCHVVVAAAWRSPVPIRQTLYRVTHQTDTNLLHHCNHSSHYYITPHHFSSTLQYITELHTWVTPIFSATATIHHNTSHHYNHTSLNYTLNWSPSLPPLQQHTTIHHATATTPHWVIHWTEANLFHHRNNTS